MKDKYHYCGECQISFYCSKKAWKEHLEEHKMKEQRGRNK